MHPPSVFKSKSSQCSLKLKQRTSPVRNRSDLCYGSNDALCFIVDMTQTP